jgi:hypothetical protein
MQNWRPFPNQTNRRHQWKSLTNPQHLMRLGVLAPMHPTLANDLEAQTPEAAKTPNQMYLTVKEQPNRAARRKAYPEGENYGGRNECDSGLHLKMMAANCLAAAPAEVAVAAIAVLRATGLVTRCVPFKICFGLGICCKCRNG